MELGYARYAFQKLMPPMALHHSNMQSKKKLIK